MTRTAPDAVRVNHADRLFIDGDWAQPTSDSIIDVIDSVTEEPFISVAEASVEDISRAVGAARRAFDEGPWPRMRQRERADVLRRMSAIIRRRAAEFAQAWPREAGELYATAQGVAQICADSWHYYGDLAEEYPFRVPVVGTDGGPGELVNEPVGVVGAIIPWNGPMGSITFKVAPALLAGCSVVLKCSPEAPVEGYLMAEIAAEAGLPAGVLNVVTADREASESLVRDPRVDKITFTGSTAVGRRIGALCADRVARCTLELGGKSAAVILDDADLDSAAHTIADAGTLTTGQICSLLTRIIVTRKRHDEFAAVLAEAYGSKRVGDPFEASTQMGPLSSARQRQRVEAYIATGKAEGGRLVAGGGRPSHLARGFFVEPTVFADVDNTSTIAREEIFGPVLCVVPAADEEHAVALANDSIFGLNASVFGADVDHARAVAGRLRAGTVAHNQFGTDFGTSFGGFKQSGTGREGGAVGVAAYLESKYLIFDPATSDCSPAVAPPVGIAARTLGSWLAERDS